MTTSHNFSVLRLHITNLEQILWDFHQYHSFIWGNPQKTLVIVAGFRFCTFFGSFRTYFGRSNFCPIFHQKRCEMGQKFCPILAPFGRMISCPMSHLFPGPPVNRIWNLDPPWYTCKDISRHQKYEIYYILGINKYKLVCF